MIENFLLHEQIGQGEYGKVYRATDISNQSVVAIKVVETQKLNENPKLLELSMTEIKVLQQVSYCPYIILFKQLIKTPIKYYFVYEYCAGGPLDKLLSLQGHFSEQRALQILWQLIEAFKTLQKHRIMHRDLKPSNILVFDQNTYKIADFGFCKPFEDRNTDLTSTMLGSPIYMAPEVLRGYCYDTKADIWSLGAVLYELLVGRCPFEEKSIAKLISAQDESDWSIPNDIILKQQTVTLLRSMLIKDSSRRCTWEYIFNTPLTKDGDFIGDLSLYSTKRDFVLQPLQHNINFQINQYSSVNYHPSTQQLPDRKETYLMNYNQTYPKKDIPIPSIECLRENTNPVINYETKTCEQSFQNICKINTVNLEQKQLNVSNQNPLNSIKQQQIQEQPQETIIEENTLTKVIRERNKIVFLCSALNDITTMSLLPSSAIAGYFFLNLINKKYQALIRILKQYDTNMIQDSQDSQHLRSILKHLQIKNNQKKLTNNFEFIRLVDTIEKEAQQVQSSIRIYKDQLDSQEILDLMDRKEQSLYKNLNTSEPNQEMVSLVSLSIFHYVSLIRSTYYMAFLDQKEENDKNIVVHASYILDCLQVDNYFQDHYQMIEDVIEEFYEEIKKQSKKELTERFAELQKKVQNTLEL